LHRFDEHTFPSSSVGVVCVGGPGKLVGQRGVSLDITQPVTSRRGLANVAVAGRGTKPYCGWCLGAMSIALM